MKKQKKFLFFLLEEGMPLKQVASGNESLLHLAIRYHRTDLIALLLEKVQPDKKALLYANNSGNIALMQQFDLDPIEGISKENLEAKLRKYFVFSRVADLQKIMNKLKVRYPMEISCIRDQIYKEGSLFARYVRPHQIDSLDKFYGLEEYSSYVKSQFSFGRRCVKPIENLLPFLSSSESPTLLEIIKTFAEERATLAEERGSKNAHHFNQFQTEKLLPGDCSRTMIGQWICGTRYTVYNFIFSKQFYNPTNEIKRVYTAQGISYTLLYPFNDQKYECTSFSINFVPYSQKSYASTEWIHTKPSTIASLWPHLEELHEEIRTLNIDPKSAHSVSLLNEKIARAYWLGTNLMITCRGNAQYFQMWLSMMYRHHGLYPPIANHVMQQVDCIAISTPFSEFVENFLDYFDSGPIPIHSDTE